MNPGEMEDRVSGTGISLLLVSITPCEPCASAKRAIEAVTATELELSAFQYDVRDGDREKAFLEKWEILSFPTMILFVDGIEIERWRGFFDGPTDLANRTNMVGVLKNSLERYSGNLPDQKKTLKSFAKTGLEVAKSGFQLANNKTRQTRLEACKQCSYFKPPKCAACGCNISIKVKFSATECPLQIW